MTDTTDAPRARRRGLGRGLDALLGGPLPAITPTHGAAAVDPSSAALATNPSAVTPEPGRPAATATVSHPAAPVPTDPDAPALIEIDPQRIRPNPEQPRHHFDAGALDALTESIRLHGVLHPIVVERRPEGGYQLVAGERRWRASQRAGVSAIPAIVRPAAESARHALELALTENLVRADLSAMEEASAYSRLSDTFGLTHEAIALRVGRSRPQVSNTIRLLNLPAPVQEAVAEGRVSAGHARALLALPDEAGQIEIAELVESRGLSVRDVERFVAKRVEPTAPRANRTAPAAGLMSADDEALRRGFEAALGTPVQIQRKGRGGRIVIEFFADEDLATLYDQIGGRPL